MRFHAIIICIMILAGMVFPFSASITLPIRGIWHEKFSGNCDHAGYKSAANLLEKLNPIGSTLHECISRFGPPRSRRTGPWLIGGRKVYLLELDYFKKDEYQFSLFFENEICTIVGLSHTACRDEIHREGWSRKETLIADFVAANHCKDGHVPVNNNSHPLPGN